jgi:hypothetical protein
MKLEQLGWLALVTASIACGGSGAGDGGGVVPGNAVSIPGNPNAPPGYNPNAPGAPGTPIGDGGGGGYGNQGGDGGGGNQGGSGGGGFDCHGSCTNCGFSLEQCAACDTATAEQLACAEGAPSCDDALLCFLPDGTGGTSGGCAPGDCGGCPDLCNTCLCENNYDSVYCTDIGSCG